MVRRLGAAVLIVTACAVPAPETYGERAPQTGRCAERDSARFETYFSPRPDGRRGGGAGEYGSGMNSTLGRRWLV